LSLFETYLNETHPYDKPSIQEIEIAAMGWLEEKYRSEQWSAKTIQRRLTSLKSYGRWAGWEGFMSRYKAPRPSRNRPHPLPGGMDDVDELLRVSAGSLDRCALIALCGYMGLRVGEAINVRIYHVDIKNQWLEVKWGKGRRERELPIPDKAVQILAEACHGRPDDAHVVDVSDRTARRWITAAGVAAGITRPVASHDLRATAGTHWYRVTKDLRVTQELLGHADSRTTELYTGITDDAMRNAINQ